MIDLKHMRDLTEARPLAESEVILSRRAMLELLDLLDDAQTTLEKISDRRLWDHQEPDDYVQLGCVMNMAHECLQRIKGEK